jgi:hypothetical protein
VGGVAFAAAGHADVRCGGTGGLADHEECVVGGFSLGAVDGGGVSELDVLPDVARSRLRSPGRPRTRRPPSSSMAVTVQRSRLATPGLGRFGGWRSGRRVRYGHRPR